VLSVFSCADVHVNENPAKQFHVCYAIMTPYIRLDCSCGKSADERKGQ